MKIIILSIIMKDSYNICQYRGNKMEILKMGGFSIIASKVFYYLVS